MNKELILKQKLIELEQIEKQIRYKKALVDPWVFLTGYELGNKWIPGKSKGFVFTLDEHDSKNPIKRFPNKEYLWHITKLWMENEKIVIAKSRQLMITWLICALNLWKFLTQKGQLIFFQSKKEYDSNQIVERAKIIYDNLDPIWKQNHPAFHKYLHLLAPERYSKIVGVPQGGDILRQYTASSVMCDEAAFQEQAEDAYAAAKPTLDGGGKYTLISTANGKKNFFYRLYADKLNEDSDRDDMFNMQEIKKGLKIRYNSNGFLAIRLHYSADPDKDPDTEKGLKWYKNTRKGYSTHKWNREFEIDFSTGEGKGMYVEDFIPKLSIKTDLEYDKNLTLYRVWDFGYRHPAVLWAQINKKGQLCILREEQGTDETLFKFAPRILKITEAFFPNARIKDFCDPAGAQKSDKSEKTSIDILKTFHIRPKYIKTNVYTSIEYVRKLMILQPDGEVRLLIHPRCEILIEGLKGGYIFKKESDKPVEDGWYEHTQDCLRYLVVNLLRKLNLNKEDINEKIKKDKSGKTYYRKRYINRYNTPYRTAF